MQPGSGSSPRGRRPWRRDSSQPGSHSRPDDPAGPAATGTVVVGLLDTGLVDVLEDLQSHLEAALEQGPHTVIVDLSALTRLSSTAVAALLWVKRRCAARGVTVMMRDPSPDCAAALERIGLLGTLPFEFASSPGRVGSAQTDQGSESQ